MHPVGEVIIQQIDRRTDSPGQGIGPVDKIQFAADLHNNENIEDPEYTPDREHNKHGDKGFSGSAAYSGYGVGESHQAIK